MRSRRSPRPGYVYRPRSANRRTTVPDRISQRAALLGGRRASRRHAAASGEAAAVCQAGSHRRDADDEDARSACGRARAVREAEVGDVLTPPSFEGTIVFPGFDGGAEWGGAAFDPETGASLRQLERDAVDRQADSQQRHVALPVEVRDVSPGRSTWHVQRTVAVGYPRATSRATRSRPSFDKAAAACRPFPTWARGTSMTGGISGDREGRARRSKAEGRPRVAEVPQ